MLKHIGRHGDRKVAILFREVPNEEHMCLVVYPDVLPTHIHDSVMQTLESAEGQAATQLADACHRRLLPDGRPQLEALHREGMIKKVPTNQVIVTPTPQSSVKLDELNRIIKEMEQGEAAIKRLQEIDESTGIVDPLMKRKAEAEYKRQQERRAQEPQPPMIKSDPNSALDDSAIASNMLAQAQRMEQEAQGLIAEAARMKKEAERMFPRVQAPAARPKKRGRPSKSEVAARDAVQ